MATLRAQLHLPAGDRIHVRVMSHEANSVVGTEHALYWRSPGAAWLRMGWEEIVRVEEYPRNQQLLVTSLSHGATRRVTLRLPTSRRLIDFAQERIAASRILVTHVAIDGGGLCIEGRREPATGRLHWLVRPTHGLGLDDPHLPSVIDDAVAELRTNLGLDGYV